MEVGLPDMCLWPDFYLSGLRVNQELEAHGGGEGWI
jgi:hypothetical protein